MSIRKLTSRPGYGHLARQVAALHATDEGVAVLGSYRRPGAHPPAVVGIGYGRQ